MKWNVKSKDKIELKHIANLLETNVSYIRSIPIDELDALYQALANLDSNIREYMTDIDWMMIGEPNE